MAHSMNLELLGKNKKRRNMLAEIPIKLNLDSSPLSVLNALNLLMPGSQLVMSLDYPFVNPGSCSDLNEAGCFILTLEIV